MTSSCAFPPVSPECPQLTRLPSGHYRLDATDLSLQQLASLLRRLHQGCPQCQVVFLTATGPQTFSVVTGVVLGAACPCSLVPSQSVS